MTGEPRCVLKRFSVRSEMALGSVRFAFGLSGECLSFILFLLAHKSSKKSLRRREKFVNIKPLKGS